MPQKQWCSHWWCLAWITAMPRRHLRSEAKGLLDEPRTRLKFGDRTFSISAPRLWNALPQHLKDSTSCQAFKKCLKTHLFRLAHWGVVDYNSNYDSVQRFWTFYEWKRRYINANYYYYYYPAKTTTCIPSHWQLSHTPLPGFEPRQWWETTSSQWQRLGPHSPQGRPLHSMDHHSASPV